MYAVKVGWVGQTFALAKSSDSGGKKSRIRRSKEDRKTMVESFIKRYQNSNHGSFPSLNLTHKEVGGSFYTVREIVREIIQENRVLGPAKQAEDEQGVDQLHEQYPLGSMSIDPQNHVSVSLNGTQFVCIDHQSISEELDGTLNGKIGQQQQRIDRGRYVNGITVDKDYKEAHASEDPRHVDVEIIPMDVQMRRNLELKEDCKEAHTNEAPGHVDVEIIHTDVQISQNLEPKEDIVEISPSKVTRIATDVVVETFPISKVTRDMDVRSTEAMKLVENLEHHALEKVEVTSKLSESGYSRPLDEKLVQHLGDQLIETLSSSATKSITKSTSASSNLEADVALIEDLRLQTIKQDLAATGMEPKSDAENVYIKNSKSTSSNQEESLSQEAAAIKTEGDMQKPNALSTKEGKSSTLNRIKLESWEGSSRKTAEAGSNPVLAVFKAFVAALVKFWTD
ncbi:hypothetical protein IFM89_034343 [Coptis chinensis]|uniref:AT3G52170-like helix-turn-helix domain-containing protein n=1 Tax=Coptis chinensis TaxID=261450 RepID=A0A835H943_9MAGN|nr:hypothetical protein IFM89_034343 [Coptis chinensis]